MSKEHSLKQIGSLQVRIWQEEDNELRREIVGVLGLMVRYGSDKIPPYELERLLDRNHPNYDENLNELLNVTNSLLGEQILPISELAS